jgi:hypothetical protein
MKGREDEEHEELRKRVKTEVNVIIADEEVGSEGDEVGKELVKWVNPERYDKNAMAPSDEEWRSTAKTDQLFKILESIRDQDRTEKVIVLFYLYLNYVEL